MRIYGVFEIVVPGDRLPAGVELEDIGQKVTTAVWGSVVPVLGIDANKKESFDCQVHVHASSPSYACPACAAFAYNEES